MREVGGFLRGWKQREEHPKLSTRVLQNNSACNSHYRRYILIDIIEDYPSYSRRNRRLCEGKVKIKSSDGF